MVPMNTYTTLRKQNSEPARISFIGISAGFLVALIAGILMLVIISSISSANRILTGVAVNGIDLSGKSVDDANAILAAQQSYPLSGKIVLVDGDKSWLATPAELGLFIDTHTSAENALKAGRSNNPVSALLQSLQARYQGYNIPLTVYFDENTAQKYLVNISSQINRPVIEASFGINGLDVVVNPSQVGRWLNIEDTLKVLSVQLQTLQDGVVPLIVRETPPLLVDAAPLAESARAFLSAPLVLNVPDAGQGDPGPWSIDQATLSRVIEVQPNPDNPSYPYKVGLDRNAIRGYLEGVAPEFDRYPANARFIFNDDTRLLDLKQNAVAGRSLDVEGTIDSINSHLSAGEHNISLVVNSIQPQITDNATGQELGITMLIQSQTSYFYGSSAARISNIRTAAANFHGLLIAPGEEFSMANAMKDVTLDNGYTEALIIFGNQTIKGVGGGVCQVSTTLFRTAFFSGFPINERYAHAYRVGYYEQTASGASDSNLAGLDATVFIPVVDLKFTNDTPFWLLMETYVTDSSITWKFYSTPDGRSVEWHNDGLENVVEAPKPLYKENPELDKGQIKQVDWSADGADIHVSRIVTKDGQIYFQDAFDTHYAPWQAIYEYGPGTKLPKKAQTATP
jgi:vancomycin resistance protein YoaR